MFGPHRELDTKELYGSSCLALSSMPQMRALECPTPPLLCRCPPIFFFFVCISITPSVHPFLSFYIWRDHFPPLMPSIVLFCVSHSMTLGNSPISSTSQSDLGLRHAPHLGDGDIISMMRLAALIGPGVSVPEAVDRGSLALALGQSACV